jgi:hypothetical protein
MSFCLKIICFCFFISLFVSCNNNSKKEAKDSSNANSTVVTVNKKSPDTNIAVKDDFTLLTKEDEEREDKSHMDMSYFPSNYALEKALGKNIPLVIRITYSRPHKGGRSQIFGDSAVLVPYGKLWRLGANESSEIEFLKPVTINGKKIAPGRYSVYAIPNKNKWTIIVNSTIYTFGDFNYDQAKDIVRADASIYKAKFQLETFLIYFQKTNTGCNMIMAWDDIIASLPISISN